MTEKIYLGAPPGIGGGKDSRVGKRFEFKKRDGWDEFRVAQIVAGPAKGEFSVELKTASSWVQMYVPASAMKRLLKVIS